MDSLIEEATSVNRPADALIAAELYILILYCYLIYIVGSFIKIKIFGAEKYSLKIQNVSRVFPHRS